jgi:predicted secreted hydrolase
MWLVLFLLALGGSHLYRQALPGYAYSFPRDYFEHRDFRTEWWYYTGNVRTAAGHRYGFELVFFRQGERRGPSGNPSAWRVDDLYLAHAALTDIDGRRFQYQERLNRAGPGIAGASFASRRVWNANWSAQWDGQVQTLDALTDDFRLHLRLNPVKPVVIHGENGVSQKAVRPGQASCYISFPRLSAKGEIDGQAVEGMAWMDHEWFTHPLDSRQVGWDWFSAQLDDGTELMLFDLRRQDGSRDPYSSGTFVDPAGHARHLRSSEFSLEPLAWWSSSQTKGRYPVRWRIRVPAVGMEAECAAALPEQELVAKGAGPSYWEGAVTYTGTVGGVGYLEMTGYAKPMRLE